jgi:hypothetical protein
MDGKWGRDPAMQCGSRFSVIACGNTRSKIAWNAVRESRPLFSAYRETAKICAGAILLIHGIVKENHSK